MEKFFKTVIVKCPYCMDEESVEIRSNIQTDPDIESDTESTDFEEGVIDCKKCHNRYRYRIEASTTSTDITTEKL